MKSSVSKIFVVIVIILLLCTGGIFLYLKNSKPVDTFSVALIGKNEFQSTLKVELINPKFELDNYEYQWWYSDNGSDEKINIEGATSFQYKIETGMVGKYIGVDVFEKGKSEVLIETVANKKDNGTDTVSPIISEISLKNKIVALGLVAFAFGTAAGVIFGKIMCWATKGKVNPLIGSAGVSAVPMAARVSQKVGQEENPSNFLLMHAMGPNVAGVIGSAVAAGVLLAIFG